MNLRRSAGDKIHASQICDTDIGRRDPFNYTFISGEKISNYTFMLKSGLQK